jgi:hypothetical protein
MRTRSCICSRVSRSVGPMNRAPRVVAMSSMTAIERHERGSAAAQ